MDKAIKEKEFGIYQVGDKTYRLATLTTRRFEQIGGLMAEIPVEEMLNAFWEIEAQIDQAQQRVKDQKDEGARVPRPDESGPAMTDAEQVLEEMDIDISMTKIIIAIQKALPTVSEQSLLVKFVAIALDIDEQAAADLPAKIALEVVPDFFTANKGLLKNSLKSSLPGMILVRQATAPSTSSGQAPPSAETTPQAEIP